MFAITNPFNKEEATVGNGSMIAIKAPTTEIVDLVHKKALELDPEDAVTLNNLGLLEEQLGYQEQAKERYRVSDELLGILNEHGIDPESNVPAFNERPASPLQPRAGAPESAPEETRSFWRELRRAVGTQEGRRELWTFVTNGFTLRG